VICWSLLVYNVLLVVGLRGMEKGFFNKNSDAKGSRVAGISTNLAEETNTLTQHVNVAGHDVNELGSQSPRDDNMEQLPNQGKPVSLGNVVKKNLPDVTSSSLNVDDANDCSMNGTQKVEPIPLTKDTSFADDLERVTSAESVKHLIDNAHQNFDDAMNKLQSEIGANEVNITSTPLVTSGPNSHKDDNTNGTGVK
jgi:hypothetical protein